MKNPINDLKTALIDVDMSMGKWSEITTALKKIEAAYELSEYIMNLEGNHFVIYYGNELKFIDKQGKFLEILIKAKKECL